MSPEDEDDEEGEYDRRVDEAFQEFMARNVDLVSQVMGHFPAPFAEDWVAYSIAVVVPGHPALATLTDEPPVKEDPNDHAVVQCDAEYLEELVSEYLVTPKWGPRRPDVIRFAVFFFFGEIATVRTFVVRGTPTALN